MAQTAASAVRLMGDAMKMNKYEDPIAFFLTWTVYGTFLQGDSRWWRRRGKGECCPQPLLEKWHRERLNHEILLLDSEQRATVERAIARHAGHRGWHIWTANARSNHVHVVVTAANYAGNTVRDQLKANSTRELRQSFAVYADRPVWTAGGDWQCISSEDDLQQVITYAGESQDRMGRK